VERRQRDNIRVSGHVRWLTLGCYFTVHVLNDSPYLKVMNERQTFGFPAIINHHMDQRVNDLSVMDFITSCRVFFFL